MANNDDRSQPRNLEGVLRMAVENTAESGNAPAQPMTEERRQFLQTALGAIAKPNPVEFMKAVVSHVTEYHASGDTSESADEGINEELYEELEELTDWCEDIDMACDFHKIGGFTIFNILQNGNDNGFKWRCGSLIAALCQNNPYCQQKLLEETNQLDMLMGMVESKTESMLVRAKSLHALSSFVRGNSKCQEQFVSKDGFSVLLRSMQMDDAKLRTKATFLLMALMRDCENYKGDLTKMGCVEQLVGMLHGEHEADHEHLMALLLELVTDNQPAVREAQRPEFGLQQLLADRISLLHDHSESEEELEYATRLKQLTCEQVEDVMDR